MRRLSLLRSAIMPLTIAALALAAVPAKAQDMMGAFQACYRNKSIPGGVTVTLRLVVVTPSKTMSGTASFTQAVNPMLEATLPVTGTYRDVRRGQHAAHLTNGPMIGRQVTMNLVFSRDWKAASGAYSLWMDMPGGLKKGKVALRQMPCN